MLTSIWLVFVYPTCSIEKKKDPAAMHLAHTTSVCDVQDSLTDIKFMDCCLHSTLHRVQKTGVIASQLPFPVRLVSKNLAPAHLHATAYVLLVYFCQKTSDISQQSYAKQHIDQCIVPTAILGMYHVQTILNANVQPQRHILQSMLGHFFQLSFNNIIRG